MAKEEIWAKAQKAMGYTDEEIKILKSDARRAKIMESGAELVRRKVIAEVIEAQNCAAHKVGARYVLRANGVIRRDDCSEQLCAEIFPLLIPFQQVVFDRIANGLPVSGMDRYLRCPDTGVDCGGFGKVTLKVWVE